MAKNTNMKDIAIFIRKNIEAKINNAYEEVKEKIIKPYIEKREELKQDFFMKYPYFIELLMEAKSLEKVIQPELDRIKNEAGEGYFHFSGLNIPSAENVAESYANTFVGYSPRFNADESLHRLPDEIKIQWYTLYVSAGNLRHDVPMAILFNNKLPDWMTEEEKAYIKCVVEDFNQYAQGMIAYADELALVASMGRSAAEIQDILAKHGIEFRYVRALSPPDKNAGALVPAGDEEILVPDMEPTDRAQVLVS
jgi:hypothetical protein